MKVIAVAAAHSASWPAPSRSAYFIVPETVREPKMHKADRRWRNFVFLTFALALFGALGAAFSLAQWLSWGPTLRLWAQTASNLTFAELLILFVMTAGYVILLTTAFALANGGRGWKTRFSLRPWSWQRYRPPRHTTDA